ncbi:MAG: hypothetical protein Q7U84_07345, partial [Polynucleobacter sp.]|nr:hypothetical protein [Polynucleobacter sp.]
MEARVYLRKGNVRAGAFTYGDILSIDNLTAQKGEYNPINQDLQFQTSFQSTLRNFGIQPHRMIHTWITPTEWENGPHSNRTYDLVGAFRVEHINEDIFQLSLKDKLSTIDVS